MRRPYPLKMAVILSVAFALNVEVAGATPLILSRSSSGKNSGAGCFVLVAMLAVFGLIFSISYLMVKARIKKLGQVARSLGLTYRPDATDADKELPSGCYLATEGRSPTVSNILEVAHTDDLDFVLFDFNYTTGYGRSKTVIFQTVARIRSPFLKVPSFLLFPETIFSKMGVMLGRTDINFPDSPKFSSKYILRGHDEAALRRIFTPALRENLETIDHLTVEGGDNLLFIFRAARQVKPEDMAARIEEAKRILALFVEAERSMG